MNNVLNRATSAASYAQSFLPNIVASTTNTNTSNNSPSSSSSFSSSSTNHAPQDSASALGLTNNIQVTTNPSSSIVSYPKMISSFLSSASSTKSPVASSSTSSPGDHLQSDLDKFYHSRIRPLIDAVDVLRGLLKDEEAISLPTIVVCGDQSSGKSSVLESLSGVSLPRGQNITTRCPLVLRLIDSHSSKSNNIVKDQIYATISTQPTSIEHKITNLSECALYIDQFTQKLAGTNFGVVNKPIYLSVYRPYSPELTLIDLPGITRNPIGQQPKDIYKQITDMIYHYIRPQETVILNVMPATVDLSTCECVMMSKSVDPTCDRTIGVITKLDCAERGIKKRIEVGQKQLSFKLGIVCVRNRSAEENERKITLELSKEMEKQFFVQHEELGSMYTELKDFKQLYSYGMYLGTNNLALLLTAVQEQRIRTSLPTIRLKIRDLLSTYRLQLSQFPESCSTVTECRIRCDQLINKMMTKTGALCRGDYSQIISSASSLSQPATASLLSSATTSGDEHTSKHPLGSKKSSFSPASAIPNASHDKSLHMNSRLQELYVGFQQSLANSCSSFFTSEYAHMVDDEIRENQSNCALPNFMSSQVFKTLIYKEITKCYASSHQLIDQARQCIERILVVLIRDTFENYPQLMNKMISTVTVWLDNIQGILKIRCNEILESEMDCFTQNSYYIDIVNKVKSILYDRIYNPQQTNLAQPQQQQQQQQQLQQQQPIAQQHAQRGSSNVTKPVFDIKRDHRTGFFASVANAVSSSGSNSNSDYNGTNNTSSRNQLFNSSTNSASIVSFTVNDLVLNVDLQNITLLSNNNANNAAFGSSSANPNSSNSNPFATSYPTNTILDMQINCFSYCTLTQKRLSDSIPMLIRYWIVTKMSSEGSFNQNGLYLFIQREFSNDELRGGISDKVLQDWMREDEQVEKKRKKLKSAIDKLEKSMQVFENL